VHLTQNEDLMDERRRFDSGIPAWERGDLVLFKTEDMEHLEADYESQHRSAISKDDLLRIADQIRERDGGG
jgi:hypothetical protein